MPTAPTIEVTDDNLRRLRNAYRAAERQGKKRNDVIKALGHEFVMGYLKYLIEYMEMKLNSMRRP